MRNIKRTLGLTAVAVAAVLIAVAPAVAREVDETVKAERDGAVSVENICGSIRIEGWERAEVQVTGTLGEDVEDLQIKSSGSKTMIKVVYPKRARNINDGAELVIKMPRQGSVEAECVSAPVTVRGVEGAVEVSDISGEVEITGPCRRIEAETISGDLTVTDAAGKVSVQSISGRVRAAGDEAEVEAQSVSGGIDLTFDLFRELSVESVSGDVDVAGALDAKGSFDFDIHGGDVTLTVPSSLSADVRVETFSGDIDNAFGEKAERTSKYAPGSRLEFSVGGEARVRINTFSGDVTIRKK